METEEDLKKVLDNMSLSIIINENLLTSISNGIARSKGFHEASCGFIHDVALAITELSEAIEGYRRGAKPDEHIPDFDNVTVELADAIIRIHDLAGRYNKNIGEAIVAKCAYNLTRPRLHGKLC